MIEPTTTPTRRKLIEVSLPLEEINRESAREKSIKHGHPSTLHLWWARRPLAAARAVLFAQLVDDPSSHPDRFSTLEAQALERERLHKIIRDLVAWENVNDEGLLRRAHAEIVASAPDGVPPAILDPFAGGGTIPLEAQRLGLEAHASDLNPVAVLINKALIEIPPMFAGRPPVFPGAAGSRLGGWPRATGLAEDMRRYGAWMRESATASIGHLYPKANLPDGSQTTVIAWIWARTVTCPNPACGIEMPLVRSWWLGKKKGKAAYVVPSVVADAATPTGRRVAFHIGSNPVTAPRAEQDGTVGRTGARCVACGTAAPLAYVRAEGTAGRMGQQLLAVVAEGARQRVYLSPTDDHVIAADVAKPGDVPAGELGYYPRDIKAPIYGLRSFADLFTNRQLVALTTLSDLVAEARTRALSDALATGMPEGIPLASGGDGAIAYSDAIATYLGLVVSKMTDRNSTLVNWYVSRESTSSTYSRQALPMMWDFAEVAALGENTGSFSNSLSWTAETVDWLTPGASSAAVTQADASARSFANTVVSTDPPYYDNIGYSDLSDYFYVWLRRSLRGVHPGLLSTVLVPKAEELVANPYRHGGRDGASQFFEDGFRQVFTRARESANEDYPITVYYAFKQAELESEGVASTGWATLLDGMIRSGWSITATWPVRSELGNRMMASGMNALASSIVLALRPRHATAQATTRRGFLAALKSRLPQALREMQQGAIAPVDLAQSTIGPGMAVFSSYSKVVEADGSAMSVKTALALISQARDEVLDEQVGDLDADTRFSVKWYAQYGWAEKSFGDADVLARANNTSVDGLARGGVLTSRAGRVRLLPPQELPTTWEPHGDDRLSVWEATMHLARVLDAGGIEAAGALMPRVGQRVDLETVQLLAYRLYELTQSTRPSDALLFNALGTSWSDLASVARRSEAARPATQAGFDFDSIDEE